MAKTKQSHQVELKIEYNFPDNITSRFATNIVVQVIEHEFKLSFFEIKPEIILDDQDKLEKMKERGTVSADCVASIIVTANRMGGFIKVLNGQLEKYESRKEIVIRESEG